jgi:UDP-perosamine 4-acetyltransferase
MTPVQDVVIIGAGGNSRVIIDMIGRDPRYRAVGLLDDDPGLRGRQVMGLPVLGPRATLGDLARQGVRHAVVGIVGATSTILRRKVCQETREAGFEIPSIIHPTAIIAGNVSLGMGAVIMAGVIVNPCAVIEDDVLINTGSIVEHDCVLERGAFLGPGVKLAGSTRVGRYAFVGIGAVSVPGIRIGEESLVAAGAVLTRDVPARHFARGVPAVVSPSTPA